MKINSGGSAAPLTRATRTMIFGVEPVDAMTYAAVGATLTTTAVRATLIPALRASRVDPAGSV